MTPISFNEQNVVFAENQDEYQNLPAYRDADGQVICCWRLSLWERVKLLLTGRLWHGVLTFNSPLQPQWMSVDYPFVTDETEGER